MKKLLILLTLLSIVLFSGCVLNEVEIKYEWKEGYTGGEEKGCRNVTIYTVNRLVIDGECTAKCQQEGYTYKQWKCSGPETDEIICVCNR